MAITSYSSREQLRIVDVTPLLRLLEHTSARVSVHIWYVEAKNTYQYASNVLVCILVRIFGYVVVCIRVRVMDRILTRTGT